MIGVINESELRKQLAKPGLIPWMRSYFEEIESTMKSVEERIHNVSFINIADIDTFKKHIAEFEQSNPNAKVYATAFVYNSKNEPKVQIFEHKTEVGSLPVVEEIKEKKEMKAKTAKKAKPKTTKKTAKRKQK
jgi:hypothetical protein